MVELICGQEARIKVQKISLGNKAICSCIGEMSQDIQIVDKIRASPARINLQLDESTDVLNCAQLLGFLSLRAC